jgi:hypothetical protein
MPMNENQHKKGYGTYLAVVTVVTTLPATIHSTIPVKRWITTQKDVHNDTKGPQVTAFIIGIGLSYKCINHFRSHKFSRSHRSEKLRGSNWRCQCRVELNSRAQIKVTNFDRTQFVRVNAKNVFWFQVSVSNSCTKKLRLIP